MRECVDDMLPCEFGDFLECSRMFCCDRNNLRSGSLDICEDIGESRDRGNDSADTARFPIITFDFLDTSDTDGHIYGCIGYFVEDSFWEDGHGKFCINMASHLIRFSEERL